MSAPDSELVESETDEHETVMTYDGSSRVPVYLAAIWLLSLIGFAAYVVVYMLPDLRLWMSQ